MVRVTSIYSYYGFSEYTNTVEYDIYRVEDDCIALYDFKSYSGSVECELILLSKLIKVEKQIKDLTIEEMYKLGLKPDGFTISGFKKSDDKYTYHYELDDYIDITDIVKGAK